MDDPRSTLVHEIRNHLSAMLMFINLLETVDLPKKNRTELSNSGAELRLVVMEPDLAAATHHDVDAAMDAFWKALISIEESHLSEKYVSLRANIADRVSAVKKLWPSLT